MTSPTAHRRVPYPSPVRAGQRWRMGCSCGWKTEIPVTGLNGKRLTVPERDAKLNRLFVAHIPVKQRRTYVLCDQRPNPQPDVSKMADWDPDSGEEMPMADFGTGNFIMPEGVPCRIVSHYEADGLWRAKVREFRFDAPEIDMLVGEVRTRDGRVFRCE